MHRILSSASCALYSMHTLQRLHKAPDDFHYGGGLGPIWMQNNWEPSIRCFEDVRVGPHGDGGKWLCDPECFLQSGNCTVWSIGSNNQFGFELAMAPYGCDIHTFDHTVAHPNPPEGVSFWPYGASGVDGEGVKSLETLKDLSNTTGIVDVLKIDCEGCEFEVFSDPKTLEFISNNVRQIMVEVHFKNSAQTEQLAQSLTDAGFRVFSKEPNIQFSDGSCVEYALLNTRM